MRESVPRSQPYDGVLPDPALDILFLVEQGQTIQAIKCYREQNPGIRLGAAKDVVDGLAERARLGDDVTGPGPGGIL